jgi:hypothetical protein
MHKAYEHGADRMWIVNVGDLKPSEITTEFFLQMAWDTKRWHASNLDRYLPEWAAREFGPAPSSAIAGVLAEYYRLNFTRKPEHLQWWLPGEAVRESPFTPEQAAARLADFRRITQQTLEIERTIPAANRDAFFELVKYPVLGSAAANERFFHAEAYARLFNTNFPAAGQHAAFARAADDRLRDLTRHYNEDVAGGKWRHLISLEPADNQWRGMRISPTIIPAASLAAPTADLTSLPFGPAPSGAAARRPVTAIQLDPAKFSASTPAGGAAWTRLAGFVRTGGALAVLPTTVPAVEPGGQAPTVDYSVTLPAGGKYRVILRTLPTHPIVSDRLSRIAVSLGEAPTQVITTGTRDGSAEWAQGVLNNSVAANATFDVPAAGPTRVRLQMVDPGVVLEAIDVESLETVTAPSGAVH